jgi:hypothetical protein
MRNAECGMRKSKDKNILEETEIVIEGLTSDF